LRCQQLADGAADPSAAAGDESDSSIELTHVPLSFAKCSVCQPVYMHEGSRRAIIAAFLANLGIALAKFTGFLITRSAGLLAESAHSLADTGNQALLMLGSRRAQRPADSAHPFGYGPERYFWAFVVSLVLFSMGGLFALYEGIEKLRHPHELDHAIVAFVILGIS